MVNVVGDWLSSTLGQGIVLDVSEYETRLLVTDQRSSTEVLLADTGAGVAQVLPVVVQHFAFRNSRIPSPTLIVEQPELHLHPAARWRRYGPRVGFSPRWQRPFDAELLDRDAFRTADYAPPAPDCSKALPAASRALVAKPH